MQNNATSMQAVLLAMIGVVAGLMLQTPVFAQKDTKAVLVLDFTGHWDKGSNHARTFRDAILPRARVVSVGIHGIVPDAWRKNAGYDTIIRAGSPRDYEHSVGQVYRLIKVEQTIIGFDVNEGIEAGPIPLVLLPHQIRQAQPMIPDKIYHPAMVAARVAEKWRREHPDGLLILRGHSDGTYAERYIFDYLKEQGLVPDAIILESPRQAYTGWAERAKMAPHTLFLSITSTNDLVRESILDRGYANVPSGNWINLHVQGLRDPLKAHSIVTHYHDSELKIQRTGPNGQTFFGNISLGHLVAQGLSQVFPTKEPGPPGLSVTPGDMPLMDERKKWFPIDPWDKGGKRGGISADIRLQQNDFMER